VYLGGYNGAGDLLMPRKGILVCNLIDKLNDGWDTYNNYSGENNGRSSGKIRPIHKYIADEISANLDEKIYHVASFGRKCVKCETCLDCKDGGQSHVGKSHIWKNGSICSICKKCKRCVNCPCEKINKDKLLRGAEVSIIAGLGNKMNVDIGISRKVFGGSAIVEKIVNFKWTMRDLEKNSNNLLENTMGQMANIKMTSIKCVFMGVFFKLTPTGNRFDAINDKTIDPYRIMLEKGKIDIIGLEVVDINIENKIIRADYNNLNISNINRNFLINNGISDTIIRTAKL